MTRTSPPQVAFSSGEIDPLLHRRFDYQRFQTGLASCRGFLPLPQGGFTRAPGTLHRGSTRGNAVARIIPFSFAADDSLVLEFTANIMRVWRYGALVMNGLVPFQLATPFGEASLPRLQWVQSADVIYLADGINPVQRLARFDLNDWTIGTLSLSTGPFLVQNLNKGLTIQASATTGTITLTANFAAFDASAVGSLLRLEVTNNTSVPLWTSNEATPVNYTRRYGQNTYELILRSGANVGTNPPIHSEGDALSDNQTSWRFLNDGVGIVRITGIISATQATAQVLRAVPFGCVNAPTYRWSEGAWSARYGYPSTLEIYEQRLCAAATPAEPRTVWFSAVGDFADFNPSTEADGAFAYTIAGDSSVNRIQTLKRGRSGLHIFALGEEYSTRSESRAQVIGPTTAVFGLDSSIGASPTKPIAPAGDPMFISRDGRRVILINYSLQQDANQSVALSLPAQHLGAAGFRQIVWQGSPLPLAWIRLGNGELAAMIYDPAEEVLGWAPLPVAGGVVEDMAVYPNAAGTQDVLALVVRRVVAGQTVRRIEEQAPTYGLLTGSQPIADACHLFAAIQFATDTPSDTLSLPHLAGELVYVWSDQGEYGPERVPDSGILQLPFSVSRGAAGLFDTTHQAETLDITAQAPDGSTIGRKKRLHSRFGVGLHRSAQGRVQSIERDLPQQPRVGAAVSLIPLPVGAALNEAYSGVVAVDLASGHATEQALRILPVGGAPLTVTAIVPIVQEAGR
jgi:hypothetical protein